MAPNKKLSTLVQNEKKFVAFNQGRLSLRPKGTRAVQLNDGSFTQMDTPALAIEMSGERRMAKISAPLDPNIPADKEKLDLVEAMLEEKPWMATDVRYGLEIIGEHEARRPWQGYDDQDAEQARATFLALPVSARPDLETMMKYELTRTRYDEDLDEEVSITDDEKVKMINGLYREVEKSDKVAANDTVEGLI